MTYRLGRAVIEIVTIGPRQSIYEEVARQIRRRKEKV